MEVEPVSDGQLQASERLDPETPGKPDGADDFSRRKTERILDACKWRDIEALKSLAGTDGGFLTDALRQKAC